MRSKSSVKTGRRSEWGHVSGERASLARTAKSARTASPSRRSKVDGAFLLRSKAAKKGWRTRRDQSPSLSSMTAI